jgi:lipopolysaccharide export system protein LptA
MLRQLFISSFLILFSLSTNVFSEEKAQQAKNPLIITSEILTADNNAHTALFEKSVVARTKDKTLYADRMLVFYDPDTGDITKIEAEGSIKFIKETSKGTRVVTSKEATYYGDDEKVVFTGEPRATDGENVVTGKRLTYFLNEDRYLVEDSKVFLKKQKGQ